MTDASKALLRKVCYTVVTSAEANLCCGSAGVYNILEPAIAEQLGDSKAAHLAGLEPDVIASGNIGCSMQIGARTTLPVVHTLELLHWAIGGPRPPSFA